MTYSVDYYGVLGVLPDAEAIVITAAYRALAARYHPDRRTGDPQRAHTRMAEINAAYAVIGNAEKRKEYDRRRDGARTTFDESEDEASEAFDQALHAMEQRWEMAVSFFPELAAMRTSLAKTSHKLAFAFVTLLLETKRYSEARKLAKSLELEFLKRYFGSNEKIITFVQELIVYGRRDAVRSLNRIIDVVGSEVNPEQIIGRIVRDFGIEQERARARNEKEYKEKEGVTIEQRIKFRDKIYMLRERLWREPHLDQALKLAKLLDLSVQIERGPLLNKSKYIVEREGHVIVRLDTPAEFVKWIRESAQAVNGVL